MNILQVEHLTINVTSNKIQYPVVNDISLVISEGETLGILGESGSGKSVTALSIMRLINPPLAVSRGTITYKNKNIFQLTRKEIQDIRGREIAMIFQEPMTSLNPVLTCGFQLAECIKLYSSISGKEAKQRAINLFKEVILPDPGRVYKSYPHQLSGGQRQRVMIAMALCGNPKILIADEPTTALDVTVQKSILDLLQNLQKTYGLSIIFISHDIGVISSLANRIIVMKEGVIVEQNLKDKLLHHPKSLYTKGLLACRPPLDKRPKRLTTVKDSENQQDTETKYPETGLPKIKKSISKQIVLLRVNNLNIDFQRKNIFNKVVSNTKVLTDVSFHVLQGETLGLVGESGSGKTTIGKTIMQLIDNWSGDICFHDRSLDGIRMKEKRELKRKIQLIFQDPYSSLNPKLMVGKAIMEPLAYYKILERPQEQKDKAIELLKRVGLTEASFYKLPHEFSGGQRQRVVIARTLAMNPELLICDESVSALDVSIQAQVLNLLNDLKEQLGLTYIFISHDLAVVKYMSDRIIVLNKGFVEEIQDSDTLFTAPKSSYTEKLISSIPKIK